MPPYRPGLSLYTPTQSLPFKTTGPSMDQFSQFLYGFFRSNIRLDKVAENVTLREYVKQKQASNVMNLVRNYYAGVEVDLGNYENGTEITRIAMFYSVMALHTSSSVLSEINSLLLAYYSANPHRRITTVYVPVESALAGIFDVKPLDEVTNSGEMSVFQCLEGMPFSNYDFINGILVALLISLNTICLVR